MFFTSSVASRASQASNNAFSIISLSLPLSLYLVHADNQNHIQNSRLLLSLCSVWYFVSEAPKKFWKDCFISFLGQMIVVSGYSLGFKMPIAFEGGKAAVWNSKTSFSGVVCHGHDGVHVVLLVSRRVWVVYLSPDVCQQKVT